MQRPTLNPSLFEEVDHSAEQDTRPGALSTLATTTARIFVAGWRRLWSPLFGQRGPSADSAAGAFGRVVVRLMVVGMLLLMTIFALVHLLAHPPHYVVQGPPASAGVLVEQIALQASDGVGSEAWLAPAIDEKRIRANGNAAIRAVSPAVLLVPNPAGDGRELDALIRTLHDRGFVVMLLRVRGAVEGTPRTYGLTESRDVSAAVTHLRSLNFVDHRHISVIGCGWGASAALLAAKDDPALERVLVFEPLRDFETVLDPAVNAAWLRPACRWGFEMLHQVDVDDLDLDPLLRATPSALVLSQSPDRRGQREMIGDYLQAQQMSAAR